MTGARPIGVVADLVFHGLACVPLAGPEAIFDPDYVAWARSALPADAIEPLASDGAAIGADLDVRGAGLVAQRLPWLGAGLEAFVAAARDDAARAHVDPSARLLGAGHDGIDWLHADLALAADAFLAARASMAAEVASTCDRLDELRAAAPHLGWPERIEVAWALGPHGRGAPDGTVVVGACAGWNELPPSIPAVVALHEAAVMRAGGTYETSEWDALGAVARSLVGGPAYLRGAHARWLEGLELTSLVDAARRDGRVDAVAAREIVETPALRREIFVRIAR